MISFLEAISPTARALLAHGKSTFEGGGIVSITKPTNGPRALRAHVKLSYNKTLCGLLLSPYQEDFAEANCKRCAAVQRRVAAGRKYRARLSIRLNGKKISVNQTQIQIEK